MNQSKIILYSLLIFSVLGFSGCDKSNECEGYDCFTPPPQFIFNIVDAENGTNVFADTLFNTEEVEVRNDSDKWVKHQFDNYYDTNFLVLPEIGWEMGEARYTIQLDNDTEINLLLNMEEKHENCCTFFRTVEFKVLNYPYYFSDTSEVIRVEI